MSSNDIQKIHSVFSNIVTEQAADGVWTGKINIAPTTNIPVIFLNDNAGSTDRKIALMRWGLIPSWSKEIGKFATFNARAEGLDEKPAYKNAWKANRRCLIPADSFFEWRKSDKQPFAIGLGNKGPMAFAGLWDIWTPQGQPPLYSCTVITTEANALMSGIHPRMPVILDEEHWPAWLGEVPTTQNELKALMTPFPAERMTAWPVSKDVGNVRNQGAELTDEIAVSTPISLF